MYGWCPIRAGVKTALAAPHNAVALRETPAPLDNSREILHDAAMVKLCTWLFIGAGLASLAAGCGPASDRNGKTADLFDEPTPLVSAITRAQFESLSRQISGQYAEEVASAQANLRLDLRWDEVRFGAGSAKSRSTWLLSVYGGSARTPESTLDGLALIVCHEWGHLVGGPPFLRPDIAAEGQADWFATRSCLKELWHDDPDMNRNMALRPGTAEDPAPDEHARALCGITGTLDGDHSGDAAREPSPDALLCLRAQRASWAAMNMSTARRGNPPPSFATPDRSVATTTLTGYPSAQCRLDTMAGGAAAAAGDATAERPRCWFAGDEGE